jgi:prepilin-type N-terminal cleavage/methylation domain-containing protein
MSVQCEIPVLEHKQRLRKYAHCNQTQIDSQRGIGMIEVMVVMVVIGIVLLGFAQFTAGGIKAAGFSANRAEAMRLAQQILNQARVKNFATSGADMVAGTRAQFNRKWTVARLASEPPQYHVEVVVAWTEADKSAQSVNIATDIFSQSATEAAKLLYSKKPEALIAIGVQPGVQPGAQPTSAADGSPMGITVSQTTIQGNLKGTITINGTINASGGADASLVGVLPEEGETEVNCQTAGGTFICTVPLGWTGRLVAVTTQPGTGISPGLMSFNDVTAPIYSQDIFVANTK